MLTPTNGMQFIIPEAIDIIKSKTNSGSKLHTELIEMLINEKLAPCERTAIHNSLKESIEVKVIVMDISWKRKGLPRLVRHVTLDQAVADMLENAICYSGSTLGTKQIKKFVVEEQKNKEIAVRHMPFNVPDEISLSSLNRYGARLALNTHVTNADNTIRKTNTR